MAPKAPKVLVAVQDPGAANVMAPVAARLIDDGKTVLSVLCVQFAGEVFRRLGVPFKGLPDYGSAEPSPAAADRILAMESPQMVLVGTNEEVQSLERWLTVKAKERGIPVVSLLDYWCNYTQRFSGEASDERFLYLPDLVLIMDEQARTDMLAEGFPANRLFVSGHPYLERYLEISRHLSEGDRIQFRKTLGLQEESRLITFASETFGWTYDSSYRFPSVSGSRERTVIVLEHLLRALSESVQESGSKIFLLNKLHPKNRPEQFAWINDLVLPFPIRSISLLDNSALIQSSQLVVGMTSMFLLEASALGALTLHIIPRKVEERIISGRGGSHRMARTPGELREILRELLKSDRSNDDPGDNHPVAINHRGATTRVTAKLYQLLGLTNRLPSPDL